MGIIFFFCFLLAQILFPKPNDSLRDKLDSTTNFGDLALRLFADVSRLDHHGHVGQTTLAKQLGVAQREQIDDGSSIRGGVLGQIFVSRLLRHEGPQLQFFRVSIRNRN